ncbi:heme-dependent oxidative N-demethylase family protein [Aliiroseovarius sp. S253]|uniref:heme-dependent oxidative N-demethylase family protein n=1 Tax=Aliiroseovarius sp. S253 TaxID=3415133 RepID=UPI003C79AC46
MVEICQRDLPILPWADPKTARLPGLNPIEPGQWLLIDDAYRAQMAHRLFLMNEQEEFVHRLSGGARAAASELLEDVLAEISDKDGFDVQRDSVRCPDGRLVQLDHLHPLLTLGALVQEDFVIMQKLGDEHVMTGAILCFPASWSLDQKFMKSLVKIHVPVDEYTPDIARRVQRLFDGIQVGRPMWRANYLSYNDPELFQPRREEDRRTNDTRTTNWLRVERQTMKRLPKTGAVVFSIHTYVLSKERLEELGISQPEDE